MATMIIKRPASPDCCCVDDALELEDVMWKNLACDVCAWLLHGQSGDEAGKVFKSKETTVIALLAMSRTPVDVLKTRKLVATLEALDDGQ